MFRLNDKLIPPSSDSRTDHDRAARAGVIAAFAAYGCWGLFPLYFRLLNAVPAMDIIAWRIVLSCLLMFAVLLVVSGPETLWRRVQECHQWRLILVATLAISINWYAFVLAVSIGEVLQTSLGYFLVPVINSCLGIFVFGERPNRLKRAAIVVAALGMGATFLVVGVLPLISLTLAITFGLYGMLKKQIVLDSSTGLLFETALLMPFALAWLMFMGHSTQSLPASTFSILMFSGAVTLIPLLCMTYAARRIELGTLGFVQYLTPVMQFLIAVLLFGESLDLARTMAFATTLVAIALWMAGSFQSLRSNRRAVQ